jgi:Bacterial regulatory protein, Fis family
MRDDNKNAFCVYSVLACEGKNDNWLKIGVALPHPDEQGFNIILEALPLNARLIVRNEMEKKPCETATYSLALQVEAFERAAIEKCLLETGGNISAAMNRLAVPRRTLSEKMTRLGIDRRRFVNAGKQNNAHRTIKSGRKLPTSQEASALNWPAGATNVRMGHLDDSKPVDDDHT